MCICPRSTLSIWFTGNLRGNHSTHSVSRIECVVAGNKVVSTRKDIHPTHVEILKVEKLKMGEGRKGERRQARRPPIMPRGEHLLVYFYIHSYRQARAWVFQLSFGPRSPRLRFSCSSVSKDGGSPFSVSGPDYFVCWICMKPRELPTRR